MRLADQETYEAYLRGGPQALRTALKNALRD